MGRLILVRHGAVHPRWRGCCYGAADVGLGSRGRAQSRALVSRLVCEPISRIQSSDLRRARYLAEDLHQQTGRPLELTRALRERDFGAWERRPWDEIYAATGNAMDGMIDAPADWRPPAGETTFELRDRVLDWYRRLSTTGLTVAISHGGPIAALIGTLRRQPVAEWPALVPAWGSMIELSGPGA